MSFILSPGIIVPPLTAGGVAYGDGSQAKVTAAGTVGQVLTSAGAGVPVFAAGNGVTPPFTAGGVAYGDGSQVKVSAAGTAGQVLTSAGAGAPVFATATAAGLTLGTPVNASGTAVVFTGIPANTKQVVMSFNIVRSGSASHKFIQLGDSSGFIVTDYLAGEVFLTSGLTVQTNQIFTGFRMRGDVNAQVQLSGTLILTLLNPSAFIWAALGAFSYGTTGKATTLISGVVTLTSALTQIQATMDGVLTFDGGSINIAYT